MKIVILVACLIASAISAPQVERESTIKEKSGRLQFGPADAQAAIYGSGVVVPETVVPQTIIADQVIPSSYYGNQGAYIPGVSSIIPSGVVPYSSSVGRTTVTTTTGPNGLPQGTVYEHQGASHIGHLATAVHIRRPGQLISYAGNPIIQTVTGAGPNPYLANGVVQLVNGQPAQYIDGNWYYVDQGVTALRPTLESVVYTPNLLNKPNVPSTIPAYQGVQGIKAIVQQQPAVIQAYGVSGIRPVGAGIASWNPRPQVQDTKWYTKTNTQQVVSPFYRPQQQQQYGAATIGTKTRVVSPSAVQSSESEKAEW